MRTIEVRQFLWAAILGVAVIFSVIVVFVSKDVFAAPSVSSSQLNNFCSTYNPPSQTPYGFMEMAYFADGSRNSIGNATFTVAPGTSHVNVNYRIETWFCNQREYFLEYRNFKVVDTTSNNNIFTANNPGNRKICPNPRGTLPSGCSTAGAYTRPSGYTHKLMSQSPWVPGRLNIPSSWKDGDTRRLCLRYDEPRSGAATGWYVGEREQCYNITIRYTDWNLQINSQNRVQTGGVGSFSSYGNYREGVSNPRIVKVGDVVQWQHQVSNTGRGKATFDRWPDGKGGTSSSYAPSLSYWRNGGRVDNATLNGKSSARWPLDSSNRRYKAVSADVGKTICERYAVQGRSNTNGNTLHSGGSCVRVVTDWSLSGTTTIKVNGTTRSGTPSVAPGDTVNWTNVLRNNGPQDTHRSVKVGTLVRDYAIGGGLTSSNVVSSATIAAGFKAGSTRTYQNGNASNGFTYLIKASDVGKRLCRQLQWDPTRWNDTNSALTFSTQRCVTIPYDFNLRPIIVSPPNNLTPGQPIPPIEPKVNNDGPTRSASGIQWELTRFELSPGATKPANTQNGSTPCSYFGNGCVVKDSGTRTFPDGATALNALSGEKVRDDMPVGSKVCFGLSVQPYSDNSSNWRHYSVCITINKHPSIQVWGGDLRAGGKIDTSVSRGVDDSSNAASFGSWVEYGVFSKGINDGLSSGSYLVDGDTGSSVPARNKLTFANKDGAYGKYSFNTTYDIATQFAPATTPVSIGSSLTIGSGTASGTYQPTGTSLSIRGTVAQSRHIVIYAPAATVTITDDLNYGGSSYSSLAQIPQLIIVADKIRIHRDVENINAWLLAGDYIDTCSNVGTAGVMPASGTLSSNICDKRLNINGPVSTDRLILKRTAGGDKGSYGEPAEVFNLRSDAYLWRYFDAATDGQVRVISVKELPPRF